MKNLKPVIIFLILGLSGCVTAPPVLPPKPPEAASGIYHRVEKGETLWRISKAYDVDLDEIVSANHISDATSIEIGQLVLIPNRKKPMNFSRIESKEDFVWPVKGRVIANFNQIFDDMVNKGINIQVYDDTGVVASRSGRIVFSSQDFKGYGKTVIIDHNDNFLTVYAKNSQLLKKVGDEVNQGEVIARFASGPRNRSSYLHFEIRKGYMPKNPLFYLP